MEKEVDIDITEAQMMEEALKLMATGTLADDEITVDMYIDITGVSRSSAYRALDKAVDDNLLKMRKVVHDNSVKNAYSPASGGWKEVLDILKK